MGERSETAKLPLPEPAGLGLLVMGLLGLGAARRYGP
jgi:hypothetical protein